MDAVLDLSDTDGIRLKITLLAGYLREIEDRFLEVTPSEETKLNYERVKTLMKDLKRLVEYYDGITHFDLNI